MDKSCTDMEIEVSAEEMDLQRGFIGKIREYSTGRAELNKSEQLAYVDTYGCQQNESDSEKLRGMLADMGYGMTDDEYAADIVVINTCAIREHAEQRVLGNVGALVHTKRAKKSQIIVFCGCLAGVPETVEKVRKSYKHVNLVFPPNQLWRFPELLHKALTAAATKTHGRRVFEEDTNNARIAEGISLCRDSKVKAWLPVMYGCNNFCAYCIVPYVRGRERSRRAPVILDEARSLVQSGYRDITLLGQNVNSYRDRMSFGESEMFDFPALLREICNIDGDFLVRFMTSHPKDASRELFEAMAASSNAARHIHLPFQSGSDRILRLMNRKYTAAQYLEKLRIARELMPDIVITSDVIVGFPGETEQDFEDTLNLVEEANFEAMFTFLYSKRPGTPAAALADDIDRDVKQARFERLVDLQNDISERCHAGYIGQTMRVLIDGEATGEEYPLRARTNGGRLVHLRVGSGSIGDGRGGGTGLTGSFVNAKITGSNNWSLYGEFEQ